MSHLPGDSIQSQKKMREKKYTKDAPFMAYIKSRELLTKETSTKKTYHVVLDTTDMEDLYRGGDSVAILPQNRREEVEKILHITGE
jgi:sulfite reductase alpha subunit-like flavoprotein